MNRVTPEQKSAWSDHVKKHSTSNLSSANLSAIEAGSNIRSGHVNIILTPGHPSPAIIRKSNNLCAGLFLTLWHIRQDIPQTFTVAIKSVSEVSPQKIFKQVSRNIDRDIPVNNVYSLTNIQQLNLIEWKFFAYLLIVIASVALFLAVVGIYGVISRSIFLRTNEIGIRRAIGSTTRSIINIYLRHGVSYLLGGAIIGGGAALVLFNMIPSRLTGTVPSDIPLVFSGTFLIFGILIITASYLPIRKIVAMEPGEALHYE